MEIKSAEFVISNTKVELCPKGDLPEYAFIGRSNVGKSSLINMLTNRSKLAMTSATPGKTLLINHFLVNDSWWLVDLPGYGYARTSRNARESFTKIITDYVTAAPALHYLFVLIDSRHEAMKIDLEFLQMLGREGVPFGIVFTKSDKLSARQLRLNVEAYKRRLSEWWEELPNIFITSSEHRKGRDEILDFIEECLKDLDFSTITSGV